jgi:hypothetical protein
MSRLPQLRRSFLDAAERRRPAPAHVAPAGLRGPLRLAVAAPLVLLLLAAVAVAASGVLNTGTAVAPTRPLTPTAGLGVPARGGSRLLGVRFADPAGGPPWGMRLVHTTRDLLCIQVGRVYHGELGILGRDGAFGDDGRFHPLPPDTINRQPGSTSCQPEGDEPSLEVSGLPESALMPEEGRLGPLLKARWVSYGLLGPDAVSVTYRYHGGEHTVPVEAGTGAYLIVLPGIESGPNRNGITAGGSSGVARPGGSPLPNPAGALTAITYRFMGRVCIDSAELGVANACPRPQPSGHPRSLKPPLDLHRPVGVRLHRASGPGGFAAVLTFTAPYGVPDALSGYAIASPSPCHEGTSIDPVDRDIAAGSTVTVRLEAVFANACGPYVTLEVLYSSRHGEPFPGGGSVLVGRIRVARPR